MQAEVGLETIEAKLIDLEAMMSLRATLTILCEQTLTLHAWVLEGYYN